MKSKLRPRKKLHAAVLSSVRQKPDQTPAALAARLCEETPRVYVALRSLCKAGKLAEHRPAPAKPIVYRPAAAREVPNVA